jgi:hypothetical protein
MSNYFISNKLLNFPENIKRISIIMIFVIGLVLMFIIFPIHIIPVTLAQCPPGQVQEPDGGCVPAEQSTAIVPPANQTTTTTTSPSQECTPGITMPGPSGGCVPVPCPPGQVQEPDGGCVPAAEAQATPLLPPEQNLTQVHTSEKKIALVSEVVPYISGTKQIVISEKGQVLGSRNASANIPKVDGISVIDNKDNPKEIIVSWNANDSDGDKLVYSVAYSTDSGKSWQPAAVGIEESEVILNIDDLPGSKNAIFRVIATDGVNVDMDDSDGKFTLPNKPPTPSIISPFKNAIFSGGQRTPSTIIFNGEAYDLEDGILEDKALEWSSDLQGILGNGKSISMTDLRQGIHNITLTARDSSGALGSATTIIYVIK